MQIGKSALYALYAAMEMARAEAGAPVTVTQVAERYRIPETALAKALQQLVRSGLCIGTRGVGGGYRLAREAGEISVLDVLDAFTAPRRPQQCLLDDAPRECPEVASCRLGKLFAEVDDLARATFASTSLATLAGAVGTGLADG